MEDFGTPTQCYGTIGETPETQAPCPDPPQHVVLVGDGSDVDPAAVQKVHACDRHFDHMMSRGIVSWPYIGTGALDDPDDQPDSTP